MIVMDDGTGFFYTHKFFRFHRAVLSNTEAKLLFVLSDNLNDVAFIEITTDTDYTNRQETHYFGFRNEQVLSALINLHGAFRKTL
jgi:hypothetical protein